MVKNRKAGANRYFKLRTGGMVFIVGAFIVLLAAWNTGENMLYLILGMMVSLMVVSVALLRITLRGLSVERSLPLTVHAGEATDLVTRVRNGKRMFHSFSLRVDAGQRNGDAPGYVLRVRPGETASVTAHVKFKRRGRHLLGPTRVSTSYPFGFFEEGAAYGGEAELLVYPEVRRLEESALERVLSRGEMLSSARRGRGTEYHSLREYFHGDDARLISWKVSAKQGKLMLRELEKPERKALVLVFDTDTGEVDALGLYDMFEEAVTFCASLASHCLKGGYDVGLIMPGESVRLGGGESQLHRILRCLALVEPTRNTHLEVLTQLHGFHRPRRDNVSVIVTPDRSRFRGYQRASGASVVQFEDIRFD